MDVPRSVKDEEVEGLRDVRLVCFPYSESLSRRLLPSQLFKDCQHYCYNLMRDASWPRFLKSSAAKELAEKLAKSEIRKSKLSEMRMI